MTGSGATLTYRHRPSHAMTKAFTDAGFRLSAVGEPPFSPDTPRELLPPRSVLNPVPGDVGSGAGRS
ncbi:hypothetical protein [Micromonospora tulbaghiae]